jgi:ABC-type nitrate/sulfonate/bicarbonate transport system permease component
VTANTGSATGRDGADAIAALDPVGRASADGSHSRVTGIYETPPPRGIKRVAVLSRWRGPLLGALGIALLLGAWQFCADVGIVNRAFASDPVQVAQTLASYMHSGTGLSDTATTLQETAIGLGLSLLIGIPVGIAVGWYKFLDDLTEPVMSFVYNAPRIALAPLLVVWFGLGQTSKIATVLLCAVFPIIITARAGVQEVDPTLIAMAKSYGANSLKILRTIILPGSVAPLSSGIRIAINQGLTGAVLAEYIAATKGLGFTINSASSTLNTPLMFDAVIVIAVLGVALTMILRVVENHVQRWRI